MIDSQVAAVRFQTRRSSTPPADYGLSGRDTRLGRCGDDNVSGYDGGLAGKLDE